MLSIARLAQYAAVLSLLTMTACSTPRTGKHVLGNPENPYPLQKAPEIGDVIHLPTGTLVTPQQMFDVVTDARVVYVGETHDNPAAHRLELDTLKAMEQRHPGKVALGMEMFVRSQQPVLDRWVAGELDEKAFLKASRWYDNWKMDFAYYRDLLLYAKEKRIPVIALNAEKELVQAVRSKSLDELTPEQKAQLPQMDLSDPYQRAQTESIFSGHGSHGKLAAEGFIRVQTLWDETMAESAVRYLTSPEGKERSLLVVAGGTHVSYGFGIPRRVFRRLPTSYATIGGRELAVQRAEKPETMDVELPDYPSVAFDFLVNYAYEGLPEPGVLLGVMFEPDPKGRGLVVNTVVPDSNAARAGVQTGDLLLALDNDPLKDSLDLIYGVKQKHVGDKSTLKLERKGEVLNLEVVFKIGEAHKHGNP
ncbi:ChaN family lipoprotein [Geomonas nitrogeniifigens]|uniref:ChaN family lipoprotein n=1 Tax=Geomonas diazotrophica TaxID=2843197 RepID=A0ABX8JHG5_9BACT|nr:ChaN family lipoprotein [Geomonas nitrogeniifigens]QWV96682.1 ChaN family lipoprotein [Geomonas nitrogeniifigens]QXE85785.1 ChaN family lipoprotein [Geomonas nitrogeniifigens]